MYNVDAKHWPQSNLLSSPTQYLENLHEYFEVFCFIYFLQILLKRRGRLGSRPKGTVARADAGKHISLLGI